MFSCQMDSNELLEIQQRRKEVERRRREELAPNITWGKKHPNYDPDAPPDKKAAWDKKEINWILKEFSAIEDLCKVC
jgi:protein subunit release factor B